MRCILFQALFYSHRVGFRELKCKGHSSHGYKMSVCEILVATLSPLEGIATQNLQFVMRQAQSKSVMRNIQI